MAIMVASSSSTNPHAPERMDLILQAAGNGDKNEIERILLADADVNLKAKGDVTCLHEAAFRGNATVGSFLLGLQDKTAVKHLLTASTKVEGFTALHIAASGGYDHIVKQLFDIVRSLALSEDEERLIINARDCINRTPLHHAALMQRGPVMETLLSWDKIDMNAEDEDGYIPLHLVLIGCNRDVEALRPLFCHLDVQLTKAARSNNRCRQILRSKREEQETLWGTALPLPSLLEYVFEEPERTITPLQLIVPLKKLDDDVSLEVLDTVWQLENKAVETMIVQEIENHLRPVVKLRSKQQDIPAETTVMHLAAFQGLGSLMKILVRNPKFLLLINAENSEGQTPLHFASLTGKIESVKFLNEQPTLKATVEDKAWQSPAEIAYDLEWSEIFRILMQRQDVRDYVSFQHTERGVYVDGTNAILVGAALIASITFAGWLQPPLGYQDYFQYTRPGAPPDNYEQYAAISQHAGVKVFWIFNSLSFYFSIAALLSGVGAVVPRSDLFIRADVKRVSGAVYLTSLAFSWSVLFVAGAFAAAGFTALPPLFRYQIYMICTVALGMLVCYETFSSSRTSNPSFFLKFSTYVDPGFYLSTSLFSLLMRRCFKRPFGYESIRDRRKERLSIYRSPSFKSNRSKPGGSAWSNA